MIADIDKRSSLKGDEIRNLLLMDFFSGGVWGNVREMVFYSIIKKLS